jgi:hypothetical protein
MARKGLAGLFATAAAVMLLSQSIATAVQDKPQSLGTVRIPRAVKANGETLPAGTYTVRLTTESPSAVVGQTPAEAKWIEFVQSGQVKGREVATVLTPDELKKIAEDAPPASGGAKAQMLKGNEYLRVWINRAGTHYLVHLPVS